MAEAIVLIIHCIAIGATAGNGDDGNAKWAACSLARVFAHPEELTHDAPAQRVLPYAVEGPWRT